MHKCLPLELGLSFRLSVGGLNAAQAISVQAYIHVE